MEDVKRVRWSSLEDETVYAPFINSVSSPMPPSYARRSLSGYTSSFEGPYSSMPRLQAQQGQLTKNKTNNGQQDNDDDDDGDDDDDRDGEDDDDEEDEEDDDDDDDDDDALYRGGVSQISLETAYERKEWQQMLQSVLRGEVIKSEKKRLLSKDIFAQQRNSVQEIWLSLRALLRGRTITDEIKYLDESRKTIDDVVACIMQFKVDEKDADPPLIQVSEVLKKIDRAESLYATRKEMADAYPSYRAPVFQTRLDALTAWCTVIRSLHMQSKILRDWTGSEDMQLALRGAVAPLPSDSTTNSHSHSHNHSNSNNNNNDDEQHYSFVERILRESALADTFDKRTLSALNLLLLKAKTTMVANNQLFQDMNLPSFVDDLHPLAHFPVQLVKEAIKVRLDSKELVSSPPKQMVDAMLEDCRGLLTLAFRVKQQYLELASPAPGWIFADDEDLLVHYDAVVMDAIRWYFCLIKWKIDFEKENSLRECEVLEKEWEFTQSTVCRLTDAAYFECTEQFHMLTNRQLQDVMDELNHITTMDKPVNNTDAGDIESRYTRLLHTTRMRARNLLQFAKFHMGRLENAAEYTLNRDDVDDLVGYLVQTNHVLVRTTTYEEERIYVIASPSLRHRPDTIAHLAHHGFRAPTEDDPASTPSIHDGYTPHYFGGTNATSPLQDHDYLLFIAPWQDFFWYGDMMEQDVPFFPIHLKPRRLRLVMRQPRHLKLVKSSFWQAAKHCGLSVLREQRCHVPKIHKDIRRLKATINKLAATIITSVYTMRDHTLKFGGHEFIEECFSFASDFGTRVAKLLDPRHRLPLDLSLIQLAIQWICFITDDCIPTDRRTFRWAVAALEFGQTMTKGTNMLSIGDADFARLQSKVARCIALLISHFDVLGTRWKYEQQKEEQQRKRGITARRNSYITSTQSSMLRREQRQQAANAANAAANAVNATNSTNSTNSTNGTNQHLHQHQHQHQHQLHQHQHHLHAHYHHALPPHLQTSSQSQQPSPTSPMYSPLQPASATLFFNSSPSLSTTTTTATTAPYARAASDPSVPVDHNHVTKESVMGADSSNNDAAVAAAHRYIRDAWMRNIHQLENERSKRDQEANLIGKVLDDQRPEDRSLVFLAPSSSNFSFRWQQGRYIGSGTYGSVYLAINLDTSSIMAVKEIRFPDSSTLSTLHKAIKEEMKVMEMLNHHNIVQYYGMEVHREKVNIFMEYCENGSLGALLKQTGRIQEEHYVVDYAYQLLSGLAYLHDNNIIHRDIKPDNILIDHQGQLKLTDFGASKIIKGQKTLGRTIVMTKSLAGTPMYMSPEAITGDDSGRNGSMDIWSLGCCIVQMVTGRQPWSALDNEWSVMYHVVTGHPTLPTPQQMSNAGIHFLTQCFIHDARDRPSAHELLLHPWITFYLEQGAILDDDVTFDFPVPNAAASSSINSTSTMRTGPSMPPHSPKPYPVDSATSPPQTPFPGAATNPSTSTDHAADQSLGSLPTPSSSSSRPPSIAATMAASALINADVGAHHPMQPQPPPQHPSDPSSSSSSH